MKIGIVLGYRLNDDGTRAPLLDKRCDLAIKFFKEFGLDKIIVSGGVANENTSVSEALRMYEYLVENGISKDLILLEEKSMTTWDNLEYSMQIARPYKPDTIVIISTYDHYTWKYNTVKICGDAINDPNINMIFYTKSVLECEE